jgi:hypothetical protein
MSLSGAPLLKQLQLSGHILVEDIPQGVVECLLDRHVQCTDTLPPIAMESLILTGKVGWTHLPQSLRRLDIKEGNEVKYQFTNLPLLQQLKIGPMADILVQNLPQALRVLHMDNYKLSLATLPPIVTHLTILNVAPTFIKHIPPTVTHLFLPSYTKEIAQLPQNLIQLRVGKNEHLLPLPPSLCSLELIASGETPTITLPNTTINVCLYTRQEVKVILDSATHKIHFSSSTLNPYSL